MTITIAGYTVLEVIYEGINTVIYRASKEPDPTSVIIKTLKAEYPTIEELTKLRHEFKILQPLDIDGILKPLALENYQNGLALILPDFQGEALTSFFSEQALEVSEFLPIGIQLASTLAQLHQNNIIHKDIKPHNILINSITGQVKIIDFSIASRLSRENQTIDNPNSLEGTLAYMAPEQTGRMNRAIDYRADFYSLGVTFYEMLTGQLPCQATDSLELIHCHIAKTPVPPEELNPAIPQTVSDIVMKLLAKTAEDRYQSALGLKADLEACRRMLQTSGKVFHFKVGELDLFSQFTIPQKLYGREQEVGLLMNAFDRVSSGNAEMMLVSGYSGIGKSSLVNEVHKPIVRQRGYFISGKFDQFKRNIPYASVTQAFQELMRQLLTESDKKIAICKLKILAAVGSNGQIIIDVIPEVERIIGSQPAVPQLGASESQNRFNRVFQQFIQVFSQPEHPLVIFLDDLQWADLPSLKLIELIVTDPDSQYLLLIGAYRDNEVSASHPLIHTLEQIQQARAVVNNIILQPLDIAHVNQFVADTLHTDISIKTQNFASILFKKTQGNPFFLTQLIKSLYQDKRLIFNFTLGCWDWDSDRLESIDISDNVVELMVSQIQKLSSKTQDVLKLAACIGDKFTLDILAIVTEKPQPETAKDLWEALQTGFVLPLNNSYKIPLALDSETSDQKPREQFKVIYKFLHDRVQQAAYSLIPDEQKKQTHWKIGQLLLHSTTPEERRENIFALVNQLNYGTDLLTSESEKYELAELNLIAGQKAKAATAYESAVKYLNVGLGLLAADTWERKYDLTFTLHLEAAEAEYLNTSFERSQQLSNAILKQAKTLLEKVKVYELNIQFDMAQNRMQSAIDTGLCVLEMFGVPLEKELPQQLMIDELADLPPMMAPDKLAVMRILMTIVTAAYIGNAAMLPPLLYTMISLSIRYGNSPQSAYGYVYYGVLLCGAIGDIDSGYRFGKLAIALLEKFNAKSLKSKVFCIFYAIVRHWKEPVRESLEPMIDGSQSGLEVGDIEFACHNAVNYCIYGFLSGEELEKVEHKQAKYVAIAIKFKQEYDIYFIKIYQQLVENLLGKSPDKYRLMGESFNHETMLPIIQESNNGTLLFCYYVAEMILLYLFKDYAQTVSSANLASKYASMGMGLMHMSTYNFYHSLALIALYPEAQSREKEQYLSEVAANQETMKNWAFHAPCNFQHKYDLIEAEKARVLGKIVEAMELYDRAIAGAREQGYIQEEALANERAAEFYFSLGRDKFAKEYLSEAYYGYVRWGAITKVRDLEAQHPDIFSRLQQRENSIRENQRTPNTTSGNHSTTLDLATVMKASQVLSSEIVLDKLLTKLMQIVLENAGAQKGLLLLEKAGELQIEGFGATNTDGVTVQQPNVTESVRDKASFCSYPTSVVNYVARTHKPIVLNDASGEEAFTLDTYIIEHQPKSVLCMPILHQGKLTGALYLENNLTTGAFTSERLEVLQLLSSQAAISIENARLYTALEEALQSLETKVQQRTLELQQEISDRKRAEQVAEAANRAKSEFLANMSHELRTPLNGILGYTQILNKDKMLTDPQKSGVNTIHRCGEHLLMLINDVLDLSKIEARKMELYLNDFQFGAFLEEIVAICRIRADQKGILFTYKVLSPLPRLIRADEKRLRQVLINLLSNAVKFTENGEVIFKVGYVDHFEGSAFTQTSSKLRFQVEDTGIGITQEHLQEIFVPFRQVSDRHRQIEGTGLGLGISRQLVQLMGSDINVQSTPGKGSIFWVDLDLTEVDYPSDIASPDRRCVRGFKGGKRKILVVDDREENRLVLTNMLQPLGFEVVEAIDGQDALHKAHQFRPDAILMDLVMPIMDGFEATRQIRMSPDLQQTVIIATSASAFDMDRQQSRNVGCHDFLPKPIHEAELWERLSLHLKLEWIYEESSAERKDSAQPTLLAGQSPLAPNNQDTSPLIAPPAEEIAALLHLAMMGDIQAIAEQATKLETVDSQLIPFATHLRQLTKGFKARQILEFIKQFQS